MSKKQRGLRGALSPDSHLSELVAAGLQALPVSDRANGEVAAVIAKKQRSFTVLREHMAVTDIRRWIWISSGKDTVSRSSTEWRKLIKARIELVGRHLSLP